MSAALVELACGASTVSVDRSILEMSTERVHWRAFLTTDTAAPPMLRVERHDQLEGTVVAGPLGTCVARLEGDVLQVVVNDGPFLGELVLRLAWYLATTRQGGVLVHAAALAQGDDGLVACGKSGDGKSTLSRLCRSGGLRLLTDEVVQLFPDGQAGGTPFRSDFDNVGSPGLVRARYLVALRKADSENLEPLGASDAAQLAMAQCFAVDEFAIPRADVRRRILGFLSNVELRTLAFRKEPHVAEFVREILRPAP